MVGLVVLYMRFLSCLGCSGQPSTKHFSFTLHYFTLCVPIAKQPRQAVMQGCLSLNVCLGGSPSPWRWLYSKKKQANDLSISCSAMAKSYRTRGHEIRHNSMKYLLLNIPWSDNAKSVVINTLHADPEP